METARLRVGPPTESSAVDLNFSSLPQVPLPLDVIALVREYAAGCSSLTGCELRDAYRHLAQAVFRC